MGKDESASEHGRVILFRQSASRDGVNGLCADAVAFVPARAGRAAVEKQATLGPVDVNLTRADRSEQRGELAVNIHPSLG